MNSIMAFKAFLAERKPKVFHFVSENQPTFDVLDPCQLELSFTDIAVSEELGLIYLTNKDVSLKFIRVVKIEYDESLLPVGTLITVVCKDASDWKKRVRYTLLAC